MLGDDRFEHRADTRRLRQVWKFVRTCQALPGWHPDDLPTQRATVGARAMPADLLGLVVGLRDEVGEHRWSIQLNDRLPLAARRATLGHEWGHTWQAETITARGQTALCQPSGGLSLVEQEAHVYGALWAVPLRWVAPLGLGQGDGVQAVARELGVPRTFVTIRRALAVLLGELDGDRQHASAILNAEILRHQGWLRRIADYLAAREASPRV